MALPADAALFGCTCTDVFDGPGSLDEHIKAHSRERGFGVRRHQKWLLACRPCFKMNPRNIRWFFGDNLAVLLGHYKQEHPELLVPKNATRGTFGGNHQLKITPGIQDFKQAPAQAVQFTPANTIGVNRQLGTAPPSIYHFKGASAQAGQPVPASDISKVTRNSSWYTIPLTQFSAATQCPDCKTMLKSSKAARKHYIDKGHGRSRLCRPCARFFWTERDLVQHQRSSKHGNTNRYEEAAVDPNPAPALKTSPQPTKLFTANQVPLAPAPTTAANVNPPPLAPAPLIPAPNEDDQEGIDLDAVFFRIQEQMGIPEEDRLGLGDDIAPRTRPREPDESSTAPARKRAKTKHAPFDVPITKMETTFYYCNTCLHKFRTMTDLGKHLAMKKHQQRQSMGLPERLSLSPKTNG